MDKTAYYFAGGMYHQYGCGMHKLSEREHFAAIHPTNGIPYLTKKKDGLMQTADHASLYRLSDDLTEATLVDYRGGGTGHSPARVQIAPELQEKFISGIKDKLFYD